MTLTPPAALLEDARLEDSLDLEILALDALGCDVFEIARLTDRCAAYVLALLLEVAADKRAELVTAGGRVH
jgi:hypothetical protein